MAWAAPVSKDVEPTVSMSTLLYVYVALALGSSLCILVRSLFLATVAYKTAVHSRKIAVPLACRLVMS